MANDDSLRRQLTDELSAARRRIAELEAQLAARETDYRLLYHKVPHMMHSIDHSGVLIDVSDVWLEKLGYAREEVIGRKATDFLTDASRKIAETTLLPEFFKTGYARDVEVEFVRKNGEVLNVALSAIARFDAEGSFTHTLTVLTDITAYKQAEKALSHYTERLEILHEIDQAVLEAASSPQEVARVALDRIRSLVPYYRGSVVIYDFTKRLALPLAIRVGDEMTVHTNTALPLSEVATERGTLRGNPALIPDTRTVTEMSGILKKLTQEGIRSLIAVPLDANGQLIGALNLGAKIPGQFSAEHFEIAREVAAPLAAAIQRARLHTAEHEQRLLAEALRETAAIFSSSLDLDEVLSRILTRISEVVPTGTGEVMLVEGDMARVVRSQGYEERGLPEAEKLGLAFSIVETFNLHHMVQTREPLLIPDTWEDTRWRRYPETHWIRSYVGAPINYGGRVIGFLGLHSSEPGMFSENHAARLQAFANQTGIAIENARLYEQLQGYAGQLEQRVAGRTTELQRAKEQVEAIISSSSDGIVVSQPDGAVVQTNPAFSALFGYRPDDIAGQNLTMLVTPEHNARLTDTLRDVRAHSKPGRLEIIARRQDGTTFPADAALTCTSDDTTKSIVCSFRDITVRKAMEDGLRSALRAEKELSELRSRFITQVYHEFRTPLATIMLSSDMLKHYGNNIKETARHERLDRIQSQVTLLTELLEDILTVGSAGSGDNTGARQPVELESLCKGVVDDMQLTAGDAYQIEFSTEGHCGSANFDAQLLQKMLSNLLSNAIKFSPRGGTIHFGLQCTQDETVIQIRDSGIGISESDRKHLFEPFFRGSNVGDIEGTGLGLAIAKQAVMAHGGQLTVDSAEGRGTTFTARLPLQYSEFEYVP